VQALVFCFLNLPYFKWHILLSDYKDIFGNSSANIVTRLLAVRQGIDSLQDQGFLRLHNVVLS
jgi:hypothetical protein